jgi:hypothetical protein
MSAIKNQGCVSIQIGCHATINNLAQTSARNVQGGSKGHKHLVQQISSIEITNHLLQQMFDDQQGRSRRGRESAPPSSPANDVVTAHRITSREGGVGKLGVKVTTSGGIHEGKVGGDGACGCPDDGQAGDGGCAGKVVGDRRRRGDG